MKWSENDELFKSLVTEGHSWQSLPLLFLRLSGLNAEMPDLTIREDITSADEWLETYDISCNGKLLEVKTRPFVFTSPGDWPQSRLPAFLDTTKKWRAKTIKPFAYIFVSKPTGAMVATCALAGAEVRWGKVRRRDHVRNFVEEFYTVGQEHLVTMDKLVAALKKA